MKHKKLLNFFAAAVVLCLALTGQAFAADASQNIATRAAGVSVRGRVTSYLPGVSCTVQLRQGDAVRYSMPSFPEVGTGKGTQEFIIPGVADGVYDLVITKPGHLNYTIRNIVVQGSDVDLTTNDNDLVSDITLVAGDFNGDGCVDLRDLVVITSSENFGKSPVVTVFDNGAADNPEDLTGLDDFYYETTEDGIRITGVKDPTKTEYIVPKSVTSIAGGAFRGCANLESITLPFVGETKDGTENTHFGYIFGASAYANNKSYVPTSLKTVVMTDGTSIGEYAFYNCTNLTSVTISNTVKTIGNNAFYSCRNLTNVTIGKGVTDISDYAFRDCTGLASITIPNNVKNIGDSAFYGCTSMTSITIPNNVTGIGQDAFAGCTSLTSVYITDIAAWCKISFGSSSSNPLYNGGNLYLNGVLVTNLVIPDSVTSIGQNAFYSCRSLTSVTIPDSVTSIGKCAFYNCSSLTSVTIPDSVTSIGGDAFSNCSSLTSVTIPDGVTKIEGFTFYNCENLTSIAIPDRVTSIGRHAFARCSSLTSITYGGTKTQWEAITKGDSWDFNTGNYTITYEGESTGLEDFLYETTEDGITITGVKDKTKTEYVIPDSVTSIGKDAFSRCTSLASITIPDSVTSIGEGAFYFCSNLTSVTIPDSVTGIDEDTFSHCSSLTSITIPDSVTSIGYAAFQNCNSLTRITIPDSVTGIGGYAFSGCISLTSITYGGTKAQWDAITKGTKWDFNTGNYTITYEGESTGLDDFYYETTEGGITITGVKDKTKAEYIIPDSVTSIGEKAFYYCSSLTSITIPDRVTSIGRNAFSGCTSLTSITIPDGVTSIGAYAFSSCKGLKSITIPDSVTSIRDGAFWGCSSLTSITIPKSVTSIGDDTFSCCSGLTSITIPKSVTSIGDDAFYSCSSLTSITIPKSVTSIGEGAFTDCSSLTSVTIPDSVTSIGEWAFSHCSNLTSVTIPDSVTKIEDYAFTNCSSLTSVTISNTVKIIKSNAFYGCTSLTSVTYRGTKAQWEAIIKGTDWDLRTGSFTVTYNYTGE